MSKISVAGVRNNVQQLLEHSNETKKRNFLETVYLPLPHICLSLFVSISPFSVVSRSNQVIGRVTNRPEELRPPAR